LYNYKQQKMKKAIVFLVFASVWMGCSRNAVTGRKQLKLFSEGTLREQALTQYRSFLSENKVVTENKSKDAEMVRRVGNRIAKAITEYYTAKGLAAELEGYDWEFSLVNDNQVNAWCMPGGKVVVYTGLLGVTQNEAALAVVMGHEITHAVAHHGNERISKAASMQGLEIAGTIFTANNPRANALFTNVFAPGAQIAVLLPNSRKQEYEADEFGLMFCAMAGYNPREAIPFWQRMSQAGGQKPPEFLATHPSDENRIAKLQSHMDKALSYYKPVGPPKQ
jgi:predicted Zn-dependent protease